MRSEAADFAPCTATLRIGRNICVVFDFDPFALLRKNMMPSTKPELRPQVTNKQTNKQTNSQSINQTDRHTNTLIAIVCKPTWGKVKSKKHL